MSPFSKYFQAKSEPRPLRRYSEWGPECSPLVAFSREAAPSLRLFVHFMTFFINFRQKKGTPGFTQHSVTPVLHCDRCVFRVPPYYALPIPPGSGPHLRSIVGKEYFFFGPGSAYKQVDSGGWQITYFVCHPSNTSCANRGGKKKIRLARLATLIFRFYVDVDNFGAEIFFENFWSAHDVFLKCRPGSQGAPF